jgi:phosphoribosylformylglycinamidine cyclo-ligase
VTGGGIPGNLERVLPDDCDGVLQRGRWEEPRIFEVIQRAGDVPDEEMEHVFNLGVGMLAIVDGSDVHRALDAVRSAGHEAWLVGAVVDGHGRAIIERT